MAANINLLPKEKTTSESTGKIAKVLNSIAIATAGLFLAVALAGGITYFLLARGLEAAVQENRDLTANVQSLQGTEQSLILLKDRVQKAQTTLAARSTENDFTKQAGVLAVAPEHVFFKGSDLGAGRSLLELTVGSSRSLVNFMASVVAQGGLSSLVIDELSFSQQLGYSLKLETY